MKCVRRMPLTPDAGEIWGADRHNFGSPGFAREGRRRSWRDALPSPKAEKCHRSKIPFVRPGCAGSTATAAMAWPAVRPRPPCPPGAAAEIISLQGTGDQRAAPPQPTGALPDWPRRWPTGDFVRTRQAAKHGAAVRGRHPAATAPEHGAAGQGRGHPGTARDHLAAQRWPCVDADQTCRRQPPEPGDTGRDRCDPWHRLGHQCGGRWPHADHRAVGHGGVFQRAGLGVGGRQRSGAWPKWARPRSSWC